MKRKKISLEDIAERSNLVSALHKAAKAKRHRDQVARFLHSAEESLNQIARAILEERMPYGHFRDFVIYDPKQRTIHAACFEDRVFHHAIMNHAAPVLEQAMLPTTYACRPGMGVHLAAKKVQSHIRRYDWYGKIDIAGYFPSIDHAILRTILLRRFKGAEFVRLLDRVITCYEHSSGKGLPIGSLTSQYFANYYLDGLDRLLDQDNSVRRHIRYMDDIVWWCDSKSQAMAVLERVQHFLNEQRQLQIKSGFQIQRSVQGISYCGYRILPGVVLMSLRRKRRYQQRRLHWERQYRLGLISADELQNAYAAVHSVAQGTDSAAWRRCNLKHHPPVLS
uniref:Reverse transcriptase domain-containing protein n=1 Tax=uncultured Thiotrichaceae bacterium TaxID=298394 RepID=A0A6S6U9Q2_9GAMM|nr:MAG: Unknown protein [uncultured Thiotrichaceae bacterium]